MLRRILLVVMAAGVSYSLTAVSGYVLYTLSEGRTEVQLSMLVRFLFNPGIALIVGILVGLLSRDYPGLVSIGGLMPWAVTVHGSSRGGSTPGWVMWVTPTVVYLALGGIAAVFAWRFRHRYGAGKATTNVSMGAAPR
jgi:hypothetical protein